MVDSCVQLFCCVADVLFLAFATCDEVVEVQLKWCRSLYVVGVLWM